MSAQPVIYVVDDDPAVIRLLAELATAMGLSVEAYQSAEQFLEAYQASGPGCLLLDVRVPGMSGMELQKQLTAARCTLPIIVTTMGLKPSPSGETFRFFSYVSQF
jgi:FixJ family two-component response regulator